MPVGRAKCEITYSRDTNRTAEDAITEFNIKDGKHFHCWDKLTLILFNHALM